MNKILRPKSAKTIAHNNKHKRNSLPNCVCNSIKRRIFGIDNRYPQVLRPSKTRYRLAFLFIDRILHSNHKGARISQYNLGKKVFSGYSVATPILKALSDIGLIYCLDWDSYRKDENNFYTPEARHFKPTSKLLIMDWVASKRLSSPYYIKITKKRHYQTTLMELTESNVVIPSNVKQLYCGEMGLILDVRKALEVIRKINIPEEKCSMLLNLIRSVGFTCGKRNVELKSIQWKQSLCGRIYANRPALCSLPVIMRENALKPKDPQYQIWEIDYSNFELSIALSQSFIRLHKIPPNDYETLDIYGEISSNNIEREGIKNTVNSYLHGQLLNNIRDWGQRQKAARHIIFFNSYIENRFGKDIQMELANFIKMSNKKYDLQRIGANVFLKSMSKAIDNCNISFLGLPLHDGWILPCTEDQAIKIKDIFKNEFATMMRLIPTVKKTCLFS